MIQTIVQGLDVLREEVTNSLGLYLGIVAGEQAQKIIDSALAKAAAFGHDEGWALGYARARSEAYVAIREESGRYDSSDGRGQAVWDAAEAIAELKP